MAVPTHASDAGARPLNSWPAFALWHRLGWPAPPAFHCRLELLALMTAYLQQRPFWRRYMQVRVGAAACWNASWFCRAAAELALIERAPKQPDCIFLKSSLSRCYARRHRMRCWHLSRRRMLTGSRTGSGGGATCWRACSTCSADRRSRLLRCCAAEGLCPESIVGTCMPCMSARICLAAGMPWALPVRFLLRSDRWLAAQRASGGPAWRWTGLPLQAFEAEGGFGIPALLDRVEASDM